MIREFLQIEIRAHKFTVWPSSIKFDPVLTLAIPSDCDYRDDKQTLIPSDISPIKSTKSCPIAIPTKLCVDTSRTANSVEELNQEIESLVLKGIGGNRDQPLCDKIPEGHRAPVFELLTVVANGRHINPRNGSSGGQSGEDSSDLSQPESPLFIGINRWP